MCSSTMANKMFCESMDGGSDGALWAGKVNLYPKCVSVAVPSIMKASQWNQPDRTVTPKKWCHCNVTVGESIYCHRHLDMIIYLSLVNPLVGIYCN